MASDEAVVARIAWLAKRGFSSERWFQFEYAYRLERLLLGEYAVGCEETGRRDIVLRSLGSQSTDLATEIKWYASWYIREEQVAGFVNDIKKVESYTCPALALCVCLMAQPRSGSESYSWILDQTKKGWGVRTREELIKRIWNPQLGPRDIEVECPCLPHPEFEQLSLFALAYRNDAARRVVVQSQPGI